MRTVESSSITITRYVFVLGLRSRQTVITMPVMGQNVIETGFL